MDNQTPTADGTSLGLSFVFIFMNIFTSITRSDVTFWLTVAVAATTIAYNGVKLYKEVKNKP